MRLVSACAVVSLLAAGCGVSLGDPQPPTASQMQASTQMTTSVNQIGTLGSNPDSAFLLYSTISALGPMAVDQSAKKTSGLDGGGLGTEDLPSGCYTGSGGTGFTYNNCKSGDATITGSVKVAGQTTTIDLTIVSSSQGANAKITLSGSVTNTGSRITGELVYEVKVDVGGLGGLPGASAGGLKTTVAYDMGYSTNPVCINSGSIRVDYEQATITGAAQFEWTGCNTYTVRNG